jgi:predicted GTPase
MEDPVTARRVVILGAAGRDFHVFNTVYRDNPGYNVRAFTATQIPAIADRRYPTELAGDRYPDGIAIVTEDDLERVIVDERIHEVAFAYSDVTHDLVMHVASRALAAGPDFVLHGPASTQLSSQRPVISITAVRTGCGKSQIARWLSDHLRRKGVSAAIIRHPMAYGNLGGQPVRRFGSMADIDAAHCTAEEREEYEPHISAGNAVFAGVDYAAVLGAAEAEADVVIWDGGNNDFSFIKPDLSIVVVDALRPDHLDTHHPGEMVLRSADVVVVNKVDTATSEQTATAIAGVRRLAPGATITRAASPITLSRPEMVRNKRVLVVEDGPTTTHGGMTSGAGLIAALAAGAGSIVDPRRSAAPLIEDVYAAYPHLGPVLPAVGYFPDQIAALAATVNSSDAEVVVAGTPIDLASLLEVDIPVIRARYDFDEVGEPTLRAIVDDFVGLYS